MQRLIPPEHIQVANRFALLCRQPELFHQCHQAPQGQVEALPRHRVKRMGRVAHQSDPGADGLVYRGQRQWIVMAGVCVLLVVVGFIVAISVAAAVGVAIVATLIGLLFAGVSVFWPVLLIIGVVMLVGRNKNSVAH